LGTTNKQQAKREDAKEREISFVDLTGGSAKPERSEAGKAIHSLPSKETLPKTCPFQDPIHTTSTSSYLKGSPLNLSFLDDPSIAGEKSKKPASSDYETVWADDLPSPTVFLQHALINLSDATTNETKFVDASGAHDKFRLKGTSSTGFKVLSTEERQDNKRQAMCSQNPSSTTTKNRIACGPLTSPFRNGVETRSSSIGLPYTTFFSSSSHDSIQNMTNDQLVHPNLSFASGLTPKRGLSSVNYETAVPQKVRKKSLRPAISSLNPNLGVNPSPPSANVLGNVEVNAGWEDMDPSLLEEFKDIVDFL
jgi:hypothetical protein